MVAQTASAFGRLDAAFNNAGVQSLTVETADATSGVHFLYKPPEIPANIANAAVTVSATYRKRKDTVNTGSIPVSATNSFKINALAKSAYRAYVQAVQWVTRKQPC